MRALIKSTTKRFRRAGIEFSSAGVEIDLGALAPDQVEAIYAEPRLSVTLLQLPKKAAKNSAPAKESGSVSPAGGEPPAGAGASKQPASESGTQRPASNGESASVPVAAVVADSATGSAEAPAKPVKVKAKSKP